MMGKLTLCAAALLALGACVPPPPPTPTLVLVHGPAEAVGATPAWCYSTLAEPDCFTQREPSAAERLIGAYVPAQPPVVAPE